MADYSINVNDSITLAESRTLLIPVLLINNNDSIIITENISLSILNLINVNDSITIAENISLLIPVLNISISTNISVDEATSFILTSPPETSFPQLQSKPDIRQFKQGLLSDPVHRSEFESGAVQTRTRSTAVPRTRTLFYPAMSNNDKETLETWERDSIGYGGEQFEWTDPQNHRAYNAILLKPIEYNLHPKRDDLWQVTLEIALLNEL